MLRSTLACLFAFFFGSAAAAATTAHDFTFTGIDGSPMPLKAYAGKVLLIVNTASECGFTGQYKGLQELYETYKDKGLVVIGVPSNDFGGQEPGSHQEIKEFCEKKFRVTFPLTEKEKVKSDDAHPFFKWIFEQKGIMATPKWNFQKYLIAKDGSLVDFYLSATEPTSDKVKKAIEKELKK